MSSITPKVLHSISESIVAIVIDGAAHHLDLRYGRALLSKRRFFDLRIILLPYTSCQIQRK